MPIDVNEKNFKELIIEKSKTTPILVDFWAEWCNPCKMLSPILDKLEKEFEGNFILAKIDTDKNQNLALQFQIQGIPAVKLIKGGKIVDEFSGVIPEKQIRVFLEKHVPKKEQPPILELANKNPLEALKKIKETEKRTDVEEKALWIGFLKHLGSSTNLEEIKSFLLEIMEETGFYSPNRASFLSFFSRNNSKDDIKKLSNLIKGKEVISTLDYYLEKIEAAPYSKRKEIKDDLVACFYILENDPIVSTYRRKLSSILF